MSATGHEYSPEQVTSRYAQHDVLGPLVALYIEELPEALGELRQAVEGGDEVQIGRLSHRLTGDAASYGFSALSQAARTLEIAQSIQRPAALAALIALGQQICHQASQQG